MQTGRKKQTLGNKGKQHKIKKQSPTSSRPSNNRRICLMKLSTVDSIVLESLLEYGDRTTHEFMAKAIHCALKRPRLTIEHVNRWSNRTLGRAGAFLLRPLTSNRMAVVSFEAFRDTLLNFVRSENCSTRGQKIGATEGHDSEDSARTPPPNVYLFSDVHRATLATLAVKMAPPAHFASSCLFDLATSWKSPFADSFIGLERLNQRLVTPLADIARAHSITEGFEKSMIISQHQEALQKQIRDRVAATAGTEAMFAKIKRSLTVDAGMQASIEAINKSMARHTGLQASVEAMKRSMTVDLGLQKSIEAMKRLMPVDSALQKSIEATKRFMTIDSGLQASIEAMKRLAAYTARTFESLMPNRILNYSDLGLSDSLSRLTKQWEELRRLEEEHRLGMSALEASGFGFMTLLFSDHFIRSFGQLPTQTRHAVLTRHLHAITCHPGFTSRIERTSTCHPKLRRRWKVVSRGLLAHQERDYITSIAVLLPQVEGIFTDLMIERKEATIWMGKPHAKADGKLKLNSKNKPIRFNGLNMKMDHCDSTDAPMLTDIMEQFLNQLLEERNSILHGNRPDYGTSKGSTMLSTRIVWAIYGLSYLLAATNLLPTEVNASQGPGDLIYLNRL